MGCFRRRNKKAASQGIEVEDKKRFVTRKILLLSMPLAVVMSAISSRMIDSGNLFHIQAGLSLFGFILSLIDILAARRKIKLQSAEDRCSRFLLVPDLLLSFAFDALFILELVKLDLGAIGTYTNELCLLGSLLHFHSFIIKFKPILKQRKLSRSHRWTKLPTSEPINASLADENQQNFPSPAQYQSSPVMGTWVKPDTDRGLDQPLLYTDEDEIEVGEDAHSGSTLKSPGNGDEARVAKLAWLEHRRSMKN